MSGQQGLRIHGVAVLFVLLIVSCDGNAAEEWPDYYPEQLTMEPPAWCSTADALILFSSCEYQVMAEKGVPLSTRHFRRTKIFSDEGRRFGDIELTEALGESITSIEGRIIHPDGTETKLETSGIIKRTLNPNAPKDYRLQSYMLVFPEVRAGSLIDLLWESESNRALLSTHYLDDPVLPTDTSFFVLDIPSYVSYLADAVNTEDHVYRKETIQSADTTKKRTRWEFGTCRLKTDLTRPFSPPANSLRSCLHFAISKVSIYGLTLDLTTDWSDIAQLYNLLYEMYESDARSVKPLYQRLSAGVTDSTELAQVLYTWVRDSIAYDSADYCFPMAKSLDDLLKSRRGGSVDKVLLLRNLMSRAGFRALPMLVVPITNNRLLEKFPAATEFSHTLLSWNTGSSLVYLDPSHPRTPFGMIPWTCHGAGGLFVEKSTTGFLYLSKPQDTNLIECRFDCAINEEGDLHAEGTIRLTNQAWLELGSALQTADRDEQKNILAQSVLTTLQAEQITDIEVVTDSDTSASMTLAVEFNQRAFARRAGDQLIFSANSLHRLHHDALPQDEQRNCDLFFFYPLMISHACRYTLPAGYAAVDSSMAVTERGVRGMTYAAEFKASSARDTLTYAKNWVRAIQTCPVADYERVRQYMQAVAKHDAVEVAVRRKDGE